MSSNSNDTYYIIYSLREFLALMYLNVKLWDRDSSVFGEVMKMLSCKLIVIFIKELNRFANAQKNVQHMQISCNF